MRYHQTDRDRWLVVVDTRATQMHARRLCEHIQELSTQQFVAVVNTHGHWDHVFGNAAFASVPLWGHVRAPEFIAATAERSRAV